MILVNRNEPVPSSLSTQATLNEAKAAELYYTTWLAGQPAFKAFTRYKENDVQQSLRRIFSRKCAYCEMQLQKGSFEVEHYRPKGAVYGCDHSGYWWLALEWANLLPACAGCNKGLRQHIVTADMTLADVEALQAARPSQIHGKAVQFPVTGARLAAKSTDHFGESPLLIDPTRTNPEPELKWRFDSVFSVVEPADTPAGPSDLGRETIRCVALNRLDLVVNRTQILERLQVTRIQIMDDLDDAHEGADDAIMKMAIKSALARIGDLQLSAKPNQPFAGMVRSFMGSFFEEFKAWVDAKGYIIA